MSDLPRDREGARLINPQSVVLRPDQVTEWLDEFGWPKSWEQVGSHAPSIFRINPATATRAIREAKSWPLRPKVLAERGRRPTPSDVMAT